MDVMSLFPPGSAVDGDGMLTIGGCRADDLAGEYGTPALVVAEPALRDRAREYRREHSVRRPRSRVVFASKAFPCTAVQRVMIDEGLGLDVAGAGEIVTALEAGADPASLVPEIRIRRANHRPPLPRGSETDRPGGGHRVKRRTLYRPALRMSVGRQS